MNKNAIKNFAIWARKKLIADAKAKAALLGVFPTGAMTPLKSGKVLYLTLPGIEKAQVISGHAIQQRQKLVQLIERRAKESEETTDEKAYEKAFEKTMEEAAYTWFNRLLALRYMEVNDYLPGHVRVLSSIQPDKVEPDLVTDPMDSPLTWAEKEIGNLRAYQSRSDTESIFRMVFLKECHALNELLPKLFEPLADYTELLFRLPVMDTDGVVYHLVHDIPEEDWKDQVQIIGWMYQYYNTEPKQAVFDGLKKNQKITKDTIAPATQLFTPDWIVRYMVENSLGRLWLEGHPDKDLQGQWKYYLEEAKQEPEVEEKLKALQEERKQLRLEDIRCIDPCMGSGHILAYAFDVLMEIYRSQGMTDRDAVRSIVEHNLYGLDIDDRASQLTYFAVMMKACQYDRRFLKKAIEPKVYTIRESNPLEPDLLEEFAGSDEKLKKDMDIVVAAMKDAKEYGSLITIPETVDMEALLSRAKDMTEDMGFYGERAKNELLPFLQVAKLLWQKYYVIVTNPPYMGSRKGMNQKLKNFVKRKFADSKSDLYACFIERSGLFSEKNGFRALVTQQSFMFTDDYKELRKTMMKSEVFVNMMHLGTDAFPDIGGEVVQPTAFVIRSSFYENLYKTIFIRLVDFSCDEKIKQYHNTNNWYCSCLSDFTCIKAVPFSYWLSNQLRKSFIRGIPFELVGNPKAGITTGKNECFVRAWTDVSASKIGINYPSVKEFQESGKKYIPYNKGGKQVKWYGNNYFVLMFDKQNYRILENQGNHLPSRQYYCKRCITWSDISGRTFAARYCNNGAVFDVKGSCGFPEDKYFWVAIALLNCKLTPLYIESLNPTTTTQVGDLKRIPVLDIQLNEEYIINQKAQSCVRIVKEIYDSFEISWDFNRHPLTIAADENSIVKCYESWKKEVNDHFHQLKANEEELNRLFINIYGLQDELSPEEEDRDVTVHYIVDTKEDIPDSLKGSSYVLTKQDVVKSLISYAVGCMMGRYSLDTPGLAYAGGDWDSSKYVTFQPDGDGILPITDEPYFEDDMAEQFEKWLIAAYGEEHLADNEQFIAEALGKKGTPKDIIRQYFLNDFFKDHCKTYQTRPIYWLFDAGKKNGFKALVYLHRYDKDTLGRIANKYVNRMSKALVNRIAGLDQLMAQNPDSKEALRAGKQKEKLAKQLDECRDYFNRISHLAQCYIQIDLDDGVKVNYEKVQTDRDGNHVEVLAKIK